MECLVQEPQQDGGHARWREAGPGAAFEGPGEMGVQVWGHLRLSPGLCFGEGGVGGHCGPLWASLSSAVHRVALAVQSLLGSACPVLWLVCGAAGREGGREGRGLGSEAVNDGRPPTPHTWHVACPQHPIYHWPLLMAVVPQGTALWPAGWLGL